MFVCINRYFRTQHRPNPWHNRQRLIIVFSIAGWAFYISWSNAVFVCVNVCLGVNHGVTYRCTQGVVILYADVGLLMNPDRTPKSKSVWPTLRVEIAAEKSGREQECCSQLSITVHGLVVVVICRNNSGEPKAIGTKFYRESSAQVARSPAYFWHPAR